jgi:hypothetical protein
MEQNPPWEGKRRPIAKKFADFYRILIIMVKRGRLLPVNIVRIEVIATHEITVLRYVLSSDGILVLFAPWPCGPRHEVFRPSMACKYVYTMTSIRKAGILDAALFPRQRIAFTQQLIWSKAFPLQRNSGTRCCLSSPPRGYLRERLESAREESRQSEYSIEYSTES